MSILFKGDNKALIISINALLALDAKGALSPHGIGEMARDLLETCAARLPAKQHQGEPVAWFMPELMGDKTIIGSKVKAAHFTVPLYTHADPGEVEQLRSENESLRSGWYRDESDNIRFWPEDIKELHDQLAERDALLREATATIKELKVDFEGAVGACRNWDEMVREGMADKCALAIDALLSASTEPSVTSDQRVMTETRELTDSEKSKFNLYAIVDESFFAYRYDGACGKAPSAPVQRDERAAFERFARSLSFRAYPLEWLPEQSLYGTQKANIAWQAWQARADLAARDEQIDALRQSITAMSDSAGYAVTVETLCASELGFHAATGGCSFDAIDEQIKGLGITYFKCIPDRIGDSIWFFNCRNAPAELPDWLYRKQATAADWIGRGMTEDMVKEIEAEAMERKP